MDSVDRDDSVTSAPPSARRERWWAVINDERFWLTLYALVTVAFALVTTESAHRTWAWVASAGYALGLAVALRSPNRGIGAVVSVFGALLLPIVLLSIVGQGQPEIRVVVDGARDLLETGTPYRVDPAGLVDVRPYLPATFLFGMAATAVSWWIFDPRILALGVLGGCTFAARRIGVPGTDVADRPGPRSLVLSLTWSCPIVALAIATASWTCHRPH